MAERLEIEDVEQPDDSTAARVRRLVTLDDIQAEMARVYRDMRAKKLPTQEGTKLVYVLTAMAQIRAVNVEARLATVERLLEARGLPR